MDPDEVEIVNIPDSFLTNNLVEAMCNDEYSGSKEYHIINSENIKIPEIYIEKLQESAIDLFNEHKGKIIISSLAFSIIQKVDNKPHYRHIKKASANKCNKVVIKASCRSESIRHYIFQFFHFVNLFYIYIIFIFSSNIIRSLNLFCFNDSFVNAIPIQYLLNPCG